MSALRPDGHVLIVGASLAGVRTAEALRAGGHRGPITVVGEELPLPYDRPPLSKQFLAGAFDEARIQLRREDDYASALGVDLRRGLRATQLDLTKQRIRLAPIGAADDTTSADETVPWDALVIASGSRARSLPGSTPHQDVCTVRTLDDARRLRRLLAPGIRVVVVGAGFIGAEVASTAKSIGCEVTVVEAMHAPLVRQLGEEMGTACGAIHGRNGVRLLTGTGVASIGADSVRCSDGTVLPADVVVVGIGAAPNTEWLEGSGVAIRDGVVCDDRCRVLDEHGRVVPGVVAVGDVARWPNALFGSPTDASLPEEMRIEHWTNAAEMAMHAAGTLQGTDEPYQPVPYFWSDQYGSKIQFLGRATGFDEVRVVDGAPADGAWLALYRRGDRLIGALGVQRIRALMGIRPLLVERSSWTRALEHVGVVDRPTA